MGGGKGGSQETKIELPPELEEAAIKNLALATHAGGIGYIPYQGNTVAALTPQQNAAMQGVNAGNAAFGLPSVNTRGMTDAEAMSALTGLPLPTRDASGNYGYSPYANYNQALDLIPKGQRNAIDQMFIDPTTGKGGMFEDVVNTINNANQPQGPGFRGQYPGQGGYQGYRDAGINPNDPGSNRDASGYYSAADLADTAVGRGLSDIGSALGDTAVGRGVGAIGQGIADVANSAVDAIGEGLGAVGDALGIGPSDYGGSGESPDGPGSAGVGDFGGDVGGSTGGVY